ncbi:MAG: FGGY-family carbohydrate kinase [Anaerococcus sp.]|nr:FGGY-family carbohydrate kinase [Anaerococcus sp.]
MKDYILAVDVGTQSTRAIVFSKEGKALFQAKKNANPYCRLQAGWAEVPANQYWEDTAYVIKKVMDEIGDDKNRLRAMSICAARDNILALDENNEPLRDWFIWIDVRKAKGIEDLLNKELNAKDKLIYHSKGDFFKKVSERSKFNWLRLNEPENYAKAKTYVTIAGYLNYKLCGLIKDSHGMQVGYLPYDFKNKDWYKLKVVYRIMGVRRDQLADLVGPGQEIGKIRKEASKITGLPEGLSLIAAAGDKMCETLGSGVFDETAATISYGTLATIGTTSTNYRSDNKLRYYVFLSCVKNAWNWEYNVYRGYWLISWYCNLFAQGRDLEDFLQEMNQKAANIAPGSDGIFVFPFWTIQTGTYPNAKGIITGITDMQNPVHLYRAIMEGLAYALREGLEIMTSKSHSKPQKIYIVGGGSHSDVAMQITADVFNLPCIRKNSKEVGSIGASMVAAVGSGLYDSYQETVAIMSKDKDVFYPQEKNVKIYDRIYKEIYKKIYKQNELLLKELDKVYEITKAASRT